MRRGFLKAKIAGSSGASLEPQSPSSRPEASNSGGSEHPTPHHHQKSSPPVIVPTGKIPKNDREVPLQSTVPDSAVTKGMSAISFPRPGTFAYERATICLVYLETRQALLDIPNSPSPLTFPSFPPSYRIGPVSPGTEGSGLGVFATRDIAAGELIMSERPLIILPAMLVFNKDMETGAQALQRWFSYLSDSLVSQFKELSNSKGGNSGLHGILDTNALYVGKLPGPYDGAHSAVCYELSRVNHSCSPNASEFWDFQSFSFQLHATRPIQAGSQIFITYTSESDPRAERQRELKKKYSFMCRCSSCSLFDKNGGKNQESKRSDIKRGLLKGHRPDPNDEGELKKWLADQTLANDHIIKESLKWVGMMEEEGVLLDYVWVTHVQRLVKSYCAIGDDDNARKWARKAAAWTRVENGTDGGWDVVAKDPKRTDWWGLRLVDK